MRFEIVIPPPASASSPQLQTPKPQPPPPAAAGAARPATIIAKRPRGRPPRKVISNQDKLNAIARHLHAEYRWSLKDVIRHMVVDDGLGNGGDTSITAATQQQQEARVGALIEAIWGQPEVLSELEAHPKFPASWGRKLANNDTEERDGNGLAGEEAENEEGDEMSVDSGREATIQDENEGNMSVKASAKVQNKGEISVDANAEDESEREEISGGTQDVASAEEEENPLTSGHSYSTQEEEESSEDSTSPPPLPSPPRRSQLTPLPTIANNPTDSISSANILPSPHRTRGKKIDYISLALDLPPDPDDDDENDGDFALSRVTADR